MAFCRSLKGQVHFQLRQLAARSALLYGSACDPSAWLYLAGDEQAAHFPLENGVLEWEMAQSGASGGAAPGRGA